MSAHSLTIEMGGYNKSFTPAEVLQILLTKLKMKNIFSFIVPYITALEKVFNLFSKIHKILEGDKIS